MSNIVSENSKAEMVEFQNIFVKTEEITNQTGFKHEKQELFDYENENQMSYDKYKEETFDTTHGDF